MNVCRFEYKYIWQFCSRIDYYSVLCESLNLYRVKLFEVNFSIGPQISLFVYYLRMRWGWEEREVTRQLFFSLN